MGQLGKNVVVAYKAESTFNTAASGAGGTIMRAAPGPGLRLVRTNNRATEFRSDAQLPMGRLGHKDVQGSYSVDLSVGTFNAFLQAVLRSTFDGGVTISTATITSVAISTNAITNQGTASLLASGLKVGDVFRLSGNVGANASKNIGPIIALTTNTLTVPNGQLVTIATMSTLTVTRPTKVVPNLSAASMTRASFTIEEYHSDIDDSEIFTGCRVSSIRISLPADGVVTMEIAFVGADETVPGGASAPTFTSPTVTTTLALQAVDASLRFASGAVTTFTSAEIMIDCGARGLPVIGALVTPDVFENTITVTAKLSGLRNDMTNVSAMLAETEADLHIMCINPTSAQPYDFVAFYMQRCKRLTADAPVGADGAMIESMDLEVAIPASTTGYDQASISIQSST